MKGRTLVEEKGNQKDALNKNLNNKALVIPVFFAIVVAIIVIIISSPAIGLFPSGNHDDALTTTAPTQTTEYVADEYVPNK